MLGRLRTASGNLKIEGWGMTYENGICAGIDAPAAGQAGGKRGGADRLAGACGAVSGAVWQRGLYPDRQALRGRGGVPRGCLHRGRGRGVAGAGRRCGQPRQRQLRADLHRGRRGGQVPDMETYVAASISGDAPCEPPEEPAKAWFAAIQAQIGNLDDLTTKARASLVAAVNEAARTGSGGGVDIDLGMTGAAAGQVAKVKAVDTDGKPTAWEPADLPGGETWEKIIDTEVTEATLSFTCDGLNCNEIYIKCSKMENATSTNSTQDLYLNNTLVMNGATIVNKSGGGVYGWTLCRNNGIVWVVTKNNGALFESNLHQGVVYAQNNLISGVGPATTLKLSTANAMYAPITGKLEVWVR